MQWAFETKRNSGWALKGHHPTSAMLTKSQSLRGAVPLAETKKRQQRCPADTYSHCPTWEICHSRAPNLGSKNLRSRREYLHHGTQLEELKPWISSASIYSGSRGQQAQRGITTWWRVIELPSWEEHSCYLTMETWRLHLVPGESCIAQNIFHDKKMTEGKARPGVKPPKGRGPVSQTHTRDAIYTRRAS